MYYKDPRFKKHEYHNIWISNNFVPELDCDLIVNTIENLDKESWRGGWSRHQVNLIYSDRYDEKDYTNYSSWWENKVSPPILLKEMSKINFELKKIFYPEFLFLPEYKITRLLKNEFMHKHLDNRDKKFVDEKFQIKCAYTIYLNDFDGGEINYPDIKYKYSPKKGDIIIHHSELLHEVLPVKSEKRYTITGWLLNK